MALPNEYCVIINARILLQLFDACLAPNTHGDGTGCDNMTAIIVQLPKSISCNVGSGVKRTLDKDEVEPEATKKAKLDD
jgi:protein phosphatase 1G